jgi:8-oxo-dGTP pyrophosphatase MutT (NUDIX family)
MSGILLRIANLLNEVQSRIFRPIRLGVRMILVQDGKVLMVRHTYMRGWHFPGGAMNRGETPLEAAAREAREEAGVELLEAPALVGIYSSFGTGKSDHVAVYICRNFRLAHASDRWEIAEIKLFALDEVPPQLGARWRALLRELKLSGGQG